MEAFIKHYIQAYAIVPSNLVWGDTTYNAYEVAGEGTVYGEVEYYYPTSSGRSGCIDGVSVKGSGATHFADSDEPDYTHGMCMLRDAVKEAVYLNCIHHIFPDASKALAVRVTDKKVPIPLPDYLTDAEISAMPIYRREDYAGQLVRTFPTRLMHISKDIGNHEAGLIYLKSIYPGDTATEVVKAVLVQLIDRMAYWWVRRVDTAAWSRDNIDVYGNPLDTANVTFKPDFRNTYTCKGEKLFWDAGYDRFLRMGMELCNTFMPEGLDTPTFQEIDALIISTWQDLRNKHVLALLGLREDEITKLRELARDEADILSTALLDYLNVGTEVTQKSSDGSTYDGDYLLVRTPLIGQNFRIGLRSLLTGRGVPSDEGLALTKAYANAIQHIPHRAEWLDNCIAINTDVSSLLRSVPELEYRYQDLAFSEVEDWYTQVGNQIDEAVALYKSTIGKEFK